MTERWARQRVEQLTADLTNWLACPACAGMGEQYHESDNGDAIYYGCPDCDSTGYQECGPPDPADYRPIWDATGEDRTAAVEELYRLKGGQS